MTSVLDSLSSAAAPQWQNRSSDIREAQRSFLGVLGKHVAPDKPQTREEQARDVAEQYVSITLVQPMLKQLRETNNAAPPFAPTAAEKQFRSLTDADLAQRIVHAKQFPLVDRVAHDMLRKAGDLPSAPERAMEVDRTMKVQL